MEKVKRKWLITRMKLISVFQPINWGEYINLFLNFDCIFISFANC
jgi:hypothetical protein